MQSNWHFAAIVFVLAGAAFFTRMAGPALFARLPSDPRVERFLNGLSVSVIAALVASGLAIGGPSEWAAALCAVVAMAITRSVVWAMVAGVSCAAALNALPLS